MLHRQVTFSCAFACLMLSFDAMAADLSVTVRDSDGQPVADAVVFVQNQEFAAGEAHTEMIQRNEMFNPFVLAVASGTVVEFPNEDPFRHHVYSFSPAKQFELKLYGGDEQQQVTFDAPGVVALGCNIHDNMLGYIYVVETDLFGKTGDDGTVTINGMPEGMVSEAQVWHPRLRGPARRTAQSVTAGEAVTIEVRLKPDRRRQSGSDFEEGVY